MRLIRLGDDGSISLTSNWHDCETIRYAILSHTWGHEDDEVTFVDLQHGTGTAKPGYAKIRFCCEQAQRDGLSHFWIDTVCINRSDLSELAESITSMFRWYAKSAVCYVYLSDVCRLKRSREEEDQELWKAAFRASRWFTRGWTLQELLAPSVVQFFSREGSFLGSKHDLAPVISDTTTIPADAFDGTQSLTSHSIQERFRWAANRRTKRAEDRMYSLLGIFGVSMLPHYGEGEDGARRRLNKKITQRQLDILNQLGENTEVSAMRQDSIESSRLTTSAGELVDKDADPNASHGLLQSVLHLKRRIIGTSAQLGSQQAMTAVLIEKLKKETQLAVRSRLMARLSYDSMNTRRSTIRTALDKTCGWILLHPSYLRWTAREELPFHHGLLWIKGKPGAGKSTIVKYLDVHNNMVKASQDIAISFYFNARGRDIDHSVHGLYRALLSQLLQAVPDLQSVLDSDDDPTLLSADDIDPAVPLDDEHMLEKLRKTYRQAVLNIKSARLFCFVDALDECPEQDVQDLVLFFESLGQAATEEGLQIFICFASRHYPTVVIETGIELVLEREDGHHDDLEKYVSRHLRLGKMAQSIKKQILAKANGIFMWVVLVVGILNDEFRRGRLFAVVEKRLQEMPGELSNVFKDMLLRDNANIDDFRLCLQWLLFARRPLTLKEYYFAVVAGIDGCSDNMIYRADELSEEDMVRFVHSSSKGLAEPVLSNDLSSTKAEEHIVQFIHESVRDFLLKDNGFVQLWADELGQSLPTQPNSRIECLSHEALKHCCLQTLHIHMGELDEQAERNATLSKETFERYPFMRYALQNIFDHADVAISTVVQDDFLLQDINRERWLRLYRLWRVDVMITPKCTLTQTASLQYILACRNHGNLLDRLRQLGESMSAISCNEELKYPFFVALRFGSERAIWAMLGSSISSDLAAAIEYLPYGITPSTEALEAPLIWACGLENEQFSTMVMQLTPNLDFARRSPDGRDALSLAAQLDHTQVVHKILARNPMLVEGKDNDLRTALHHAARSDAAAALGLLLDHGARIDARDRYGKSALQYAAKAWLGTEPRKTTALETLLNRGAHANHQDDSGRTALWVAVQYIYPTAVELLLRYGASPVAQDYNRQTVFWAFIDAASPSNWRHWGGSTRAMLLRQAGELAIVVARLLLAAGADLEYRDSLGQTVLLAAVTQPENDAMITVVTSFIKLGVDCNAVDSSGSTALMLAAQDGKTMVMQELINAGANVHLRDRDSRTALHIAASSGHAHACRLLLHVNADVRALDRESKTAHQYAQDSMSSDCIKVLQEAGGGD